MFFLIRKPTSIHQAIQQIRNSSSFVNVAINNQGIATVKLQRKPVNSLNLELATELNNALEQVASDKAKGMILTSGLDQVFSGGLDFMEMYKPDPERARHFCETAHDLFLNLYKMAIPTVAVVNGHATAGDCFLTLCCEYRIMVKKFIIGMNETRLGYVLPECYLRLMGSTISQRDAELAVTSGKMFSADEALSIRLIDEVVSNKDEGVARTEEFFKRFDGVNPLARQMTKITYRKKIINLMMDQKEADLDVFEYD